MTTGKSKAEPAAVVTWRQRWRPAAEGARIYGMVMLGGVVGSLLRWLVALLLPQSQGGLPWGTFAANASGCFVIGFYAALTGPDGRVFVGPLVRQFVMIGICGGYTTFSSFSLETLHFLVARDYGSAALYIAISLASWLAAVWLGDALAWRINDYGRL